MRNPSNPRPRLVIVGSLNMDLVLRVDRLPRPGETIRGEELNMVSGGKGANQAVAAARLGAASVMVGRVGDDAFGNRLRQNLVSFQVDTQHVRVTENCSSGVALISVEKGGQNSITIVSGANGRMSPRDLSPLEQVIDQADAVILQLEIPLETVAAAAAMARRKNVPTILDPAPAISDLPDDLFEVDILSPNQSEAELLTGQPVTNGSEAELAARILLERGARQVVVKMGSQGALALSSDKGPCQVKAFEVAVVDTTAAGDAFTAALALRHAQGFTLEEATTFACAAGSLAASKFGAQPSMPHEEEVLSIMKKQDRLTQP